MRLQPTDVNPGSQGAILLHQLGLLPATVQCDCTVQIWLFNEMR